MDKLWLGHRRRHQSEDETNDSCIERTSIGPSEVTNRTLKYTLAAVRGGENWIQDSNAPGGWRPGPKRKYQGLRGGGPISQGQKQVKCEGTQDQQVLSGEPKDRTYLVRKRQTIEAWLEKTEDTGIDPNTIKPPSAALREEMCRKTESHMVEDEESYEGKEHLQGYWTDEKLEANERRKQKAMGKVMSFLRLMNEKLESRKNPKRSLRLAGLSENDR